MIGMFAKEKQLHGTRKNEKWANIEMRIPAQFPTSRRCKSVGLTRMHENVNKLCAQGIPCKIQAAQAVTFKSCAFQRLTRCERRSGGKISG